MAFRAPDVKQVLNGHYLLNTMACFLYPLLRSVAPICYWLFADGECSPDYRDLELLSFLAIVLGVKNRKLKPASWQEFISMVFMFSKISNFVLFARQDIRLGVLYIVICLVLFLLFPEPSYSGPDEVKFFRGPALEDALKEDPEVTWMVEFYAPWCPPCVRFASRFAELSLKYNQEYLKFGKLDVGKYPVIAKKYQVDNSAISKQLPTLILFEGGKETKRKPFVNTKAVIIPYTFSEENITRDFDLKGLYAAAENKSKTKRKIADKQEKKKKEQ